MATPARSITSLANFFDDSSRAAARFGPQTGILSRANASTRPAASGASGPTTTRSTAKLAGHRRHSTDVVGIDALDHRTQFGQARVAGQRHEAIHPTALSELPADGVLAPAAANQQDPHFSIN